MEKISIIIPIYKVEKYLDRGIESILNQTYKNLEIILVDDGSPDNCPKMCDEWAKRDNRIKVIHKENGGVSSARNAGLEIASGDFITFFDPDDLVDETMYEKLLKLAVEEKSDIAMCGYLYIFENDNSKKVVKEINLSKLTDEKIFPYLLKVGNKTIDGRIETENIFGSVWRGIYSKKILNKIKFDRFTVCEDLLFVIEVFNRNPKVSILEEHLYKYVQRETSAVHNFNENKINNRICAYEEICKRMKDKVSEEDLKAYKFHIYASISNEILKNRQKEKLKYVLSSKFLRDLNTKENYKCAMKLVKSSKHKIAYWLVYRKLFSLYSFFLKFI